MSLTNPNYGAVNSLSPDELVPDTATRPHQRRNTDATSHSRRSQTMESRSPIAHPSLAQYSEQDPFLPPDSRSGSPTASPPLTTQQQRRRRISTFWMLPVVLMANFSRGMTMAPRIEVYTHISCEEIHHSVSPTPLPNITASPFFPLSLRDFQIASSPLVLDPSIPSTFIYSTHQMKENQSLIEREVRVQTSPNGCLHDPAVQSRAASIQATLGTIVGVLSIVTAGYWGQVSDAFGRKAVLSANLFGMGFHDVIYILVSIPQSVFRRHAWGFLVLGPIVEGLLGGLTSLHAAENAYLADCGQSGSRSTIFAYYQGATYISLALGPQIAGVIVSILATDARTTMFYTGLAFNIAVFCYALLILPETVTPDMMHHARHVDGYDFGPNWQTMKTKEKWARWIRGARYRLLAPLTIFGPKRKPGGGWDFNMTFLVIAQLTHLLSVGVVQVKFLYAQHTFAWSVKQLSHYISFLWILRAFHLLLLLPTIVRLIKRKSSPSTGAIATQRVSQDMIFDYRVAQLSIFIDALSYVLTLLAPASSQTLFVVFTSLSSFTAGVTPAIHALAVSYLFALNDDANVGQMFGGMSMLQAMSHTVQPILFGVVYSETAATYPRAIFALAAGLLISSSALFTLLRMDVTPRFEGARGAEMEQDSANDERRVSDVEASVEHEVYGGGRGEGGRL